MACVHVYMCVPELSREGEHRRLWNIYIYIYIYIYYIHTRARARIHYTHIFTYIHRYTDTHMHICTHTHIPHIHVYRDVFDCGPELSRDGEYASLLDGSSAFAYCDLERDPLELWALNMQVVCVCIYIYIYMYAYIYMEVCPIWSVIR